MQKRRWSRLVLVAALAAVAGCTGQPTPQTASPAVASSTPPAPTTPAASARPTTPAPAPTAITYRVGEEQVTFTEPAHKGPTGQHLGRRTLVTQIWYPLAGGSFPVLMFAPGYRQCASAYSALLQAWASAGYVVAAVNFPLTNCNMGASADEQDLVNQPQDMSFLLSSLLALSAQTGNMLSGLLDPNEVAAAGQSDGGDTVAALAANTCCTDTRLKAVAVLSGAEWPPMPGQYFPGTAPPILFTQGDADTVNPPGASQQLYLADQGTRYYLDLLGASHLPPYEGSNPTERLVARVTLAFFDQYVRGRAAAQDTMTREGNVAGTAKLVSGSQPPP
jgi:predicted dienelactone hydrolase